MKSKRFVAIIMTVIMVFAMCSCASAAASDGSDKKEPVAASETEDKDTSKAEATEPAGSTAAAEEVNEFGFTDSQMQELYDSIAASIIKEYLEPNKIAPEDFEWPNEAEIGWSYFSELSSIYSFNKFNDAGLEATTIPGDASEKAIIDATFDGIINWLETSAENYDMQYYIKTINSLDPFSEVIPQKVDLTKPIGTETESEAETEK